MTNIARGRLIFDKTKNDGQTIPIHNMLVKLYDHDTCTPDDLIEVGYTDLDGYFEIRYDPAKAGMLDTPDLYIRLYELVPSYKKGKLTETESPVVGFDCPVVDNVKIADYTFGEIEVKFWEYRPAVGSYTPRLLINDEEGYPIAQPPRWGRKVEIGKVAAQSAVYKNITSFPPNETMEMTANGVEPLPRSDAYLVETALNGFYPCKLKKDKDGKRLYSDFKWKGMNQTGRRYAPDTTAYFTVAEGGKTLELESIEVTERKGYARGYDPVMKETVRYTEENCRDVPGKWENVRKLWRINYFLFGEIYEHIAAFHFNVEQYILPFMRNVRKNPIYALLYPHFAGTVWINSMADPLMTDPEGLVPLTSAATPDAIEHSTREAFGWNNWKDWSPREPITDDHRFAKVQKLYWNLLEDYVSEYFDLPEVREGIERHWAEIYRMSEELVRHAVPYTQDEAVYTDDNEINKASTQHETVNGVLVAVSALTKDEKLTDDNRAKNISELKQFCKYLLMFSTLKHCWTNDAQYEIGGEPDFCPFGVDINILEEENINKPAITEAIKNRLIGDSWFTIANKWGYILSDESKDMNPRLKELLTQRKGEFLALGFKVENIRSCINT